MHSETSIPRKTLWNWTFPGYCITLSTGAPDLVTDAIQNSAFSLKVAQLKRPPDRYYVLWHPIYIHFSVPVDSGFSSWCWKWDRQARRQQTGHSVTKWGIKMSCSTFLTWWFLLVRLLQVVQGLLEVSKVVIGHAGAVQCFKVLPFLMEHFQTVFLHSFIVHQLHLQKAGYKEKKVPLFMCSIGFSTRYIEVQLITEINE